MGLDVIAGPKRARRRRAGSTTSCVQMKVE
jgi:hypothetical protein